MTDFIDPRTSHSIIDKIKLFEGAPIAPNVSNTATMGKHSALKSIKSWAKDSKVKDREVSKTKNVSISVREDLNKPSIPAVVLHNRSPTKEFTKREPVVTQTEESIDTYNFKVRKETSDATDSPLTAMPLAKDPQSSPRTKQKEKVIRLEVEDSDEDSDIVTLQQLSLEEKQMVRNLVRITKSKNKVLDNIEDSFSRERQAITAQFEAEKVVWTKEMQRIENDLLQAHDQVRHCESLNTTLQNKLRLTLEDLQETRDDLEQAHIAIAKYQRLLADYKKNTDTELSNKSRTLEYMDKKLVALNKLRDSMECIICEERIAKIVLNPCHHLVLCSVCSHLVTQCPMCRSTITQRFEVYSNWVI